MQMVKWYMLVIRSMLGKMWCIYTFCNHNCICEAGEAKAKRSKKNVAPNVESSFCEGAPNQEQFEAIHKNVI